MDASELQAIGDTLMRLVTPGMTPKELVKAVRKEHPDARRKDIARAAFHAIIANATRIPASCATSGPSRLPSAPSNWNKLPRIVALALLET
ncbi:hypothetical protein SAMN03159463_02663 [Mesorhizobium sp. NFR06]|uniref:hypothetical protein n=1 Tax=Mesorhizobium sp. NFR06 TaxID=1566290 RepID=UPI0008E0FBE9|nr:hypothetical protein [Mesorhizobium sp. NFR06]SFO68122.1 hypothetical protein SAMN03159463_02663 [Mesorhizobium sp. NFR06]